MLYLPTINPARTSLRNPLKAPRDWLTVVRCPGDCANLRHVNIRASIVAELPGTGGVFVGNFLGDAVIADQFGRSPLGSLPRSAFWNNAAAAKPPLRAPYNLRSDRPPRCSSWGARVLYPLFVGVLWASLMADAVASAACLFSAAQGNFMEILDNKNGGPRPVTPGQSPSTMVAPDNFSISL